MSVISEFSTGIMAAAQKGGAGTLLVDARHRFPASGIAYTADLVLTADHVVTREEDLGVITADGKEFNVTIAGRDPSSDLALLRLKEAALRPAAVAGTAPQVGQLTLALGRPSRAGIQASCGIITAIGGPTRTGRGVLLNAYIQSETTPYPGFSGGPLVNTEGEVLGLNTSGLTRGGSLTIPAKFAWEAAESLAKHGSVKRGYLGVRTQIVDLPEATRLGLAPRQERGLLVMWLEEKGPAANAGLLLGDIIIAVGSRSVGDPDDLFGALTSDTVGKSLEIRIVRAGKPQTVNVLVGERK